MEQSQIVESGVQLFSRINHSLSSFCLKDINPVLFEKGAPCSNEIIEVTGEFTDDLLLDFLIRCILPKELNIDWKESGVVFVNTTHHISILKITGVIDAHLKYLKIKNRKQVIEKALSYITILNCYSSEQMEITLLNLGKIIQDRDKVNLLIIDDITSQFWIAKQNNPKLSLDQFSKQNFQILKSIVKDLNILIIFSRYQVGDLTKTVDLHVHYKIIGDKINTCKSQFIVIDNVRESTKVVPFRLEKFINFLQSNTS